MRCVVRERRHMESEAVPLHILARPQCPRIRQSHVVIPQEDHLPAQDSERTNTNTLQVKERHRWVVSHALPLLWNLPSFSTPYIEGTTCIPFLFGNMNISDEKLTINFTWPFRFMCLHVGSEPDLKLSSEAGTAWCWIWGRGRWAWVFN